MDPFSSILKTAQEASRMVQTPPIFLGTVTSILPLRVFIDGIDHDKSFLLQNPTLTDLKVGNKVAVTSVQGCDQFLILCQVVSA